MWSRLVTLSYLFVHWGLGIIIGSTLVAYHPFVWIGIGMVFTGQIIVALDKHNKKKVNK